MDGIKVLTLSGWTQPIDALGVLAPKAEHLDYIDHTSESILNHAGEYDLVIGWSLGGVLARQLLKHGAIKARALVNIAAPYQFVQDAGLAQAMPQETFEQFLQNYRSDAQRTSDRFYGLLVKGDANARQIRQQLAHHPRVHDVAEWARWMDYLRDYSARDHDYSVLPKTLIIHGKKDEIVPPFQAELLAEAMNAKLMLMPEAGHVPHLHNTSAVRDAIEQFIA